MIDLKHSELASLGQSPERLVFADENEDQEALRLPLELSSMKPQKLSDTESRQKGKYAHFRRASIASSPSRIREDSEQ